MRKVLSDGAAWYEIRRWARDELIEDIELEFLRTLDCDNIVCVRNIVVYRGARMSRLRMYKRVFYTHTRRLCQSDAKASRSGAGGEY